MSTASRAGAPPVVLVVSGWYPSIDGPTSGRFVADQVRALAASGRVRPLVVSFDPLPIWGSRDLRRRERDAVGAMVAAWAGADGGSPFRAACSVADAPGPIARIPVPAPDSTASAAVAVGHREAALEAAVGALAVGGGIAVVHAHNGIPDGVAAARFARRHGLPLVMTEHASTLPSVLTDPLRRELYREATAEASVVIAVSRALAADILAVDPSVGPRLRVVPNVVAVDDFTAPPTAGRAGRELLFVGYRKTTKGIDTLLDAFVLAAGSRPDLRLRLIGPPGGADDERRWRQRAASAGLAEAVSFEPEAGRAEVAAAMARADVFVHASPRETFGVVAAEALASGLPVVTADSGGVTEVLGPEPDLFGRIVRPGDAVGMSEAILHVLAHRDRFPAEAARSMVVQRFGPPAVAGQLLDAYIATHAARDGREPAGTVRAEAGSDGGAIVVVGLDRARAARIIGSIPAARRLRIVLVTAEATSPDLPVGLAGARTVTGADSRSAARRALAGVAGEDAAARRRGLRSRPITVLRELAWRLPQRERSLLERATAVAAGAAASWPGAFVIGLDGFDALVAARFVDAGRLRALPGAGRWLADDPAGEEPGGVAATAPAGTGR